MGVRLAEAVLGQLVHHLRPGECLGQEDDLAVFPLHLADEPLPEWKRLGVRVVDAKDADSLLDPIKDYRQQLCPQLPPLLALEIERHDVLVLLGRILGELDRSIRPVLEPLRMFARVWVVGRALEGYVERDVDALLRCDLDEPAELVEGAELRVDRLMPTLLRAYGPRTARLAGLRRLVVGSLALGLADGMDRR